MKHFGQKLLKMCPKLGFLKLSTIDILDQVITCGGEGPDWITEGHLKVGVASARIYSNCLPQLRH